MRTARDGTDRQLRRARLLAARPRPGGGINRCGILCGDWDRGAVVRAWMDDTRTADPHDDKEKDNERL